MIIYYQTLVDKTGQFYDVEIVITSPCSICQSEIHFIEHQSLSYRYLCPEMQSQTPHQLSLTFKIAAKSMNLGYLFQEAYYFALLVMDDYLAKFIHHLHGRLKI